MSSRFRNIIRVQGGILLVLSAAMFVPMFMALHLGESEAQQAFATVIACCLFVGIVIRFCISPIQAKKLKLRDGFLLVSLTWLLCSLVGALPFCLSGAIPSVIDAFFESCSGFSTTGASVLVDIEALPRSILFWRSFTHWLGGMGVVIFLIPLLPVDDANAQLASHTESTILSSDRQSAVFSNTVKRLYLIYLLLTLLETLLLKLGGMSFYDALIHSFGTVSTGGFSNYNDSIAHFGSPYIRIVIIVFMLLSGLNFTLFFLARRRGISALLRDEETRFYFSVIAVTAVSIFAVNQVFTHFSDMGNSLLDSIFQVSSIITTTGYTTVDYNMWPTFSKMVLLCLFLFGGCSASSASGVKCARTLVCLKLVRRSVSLRLHPNRIVPLTLNDAELPTEVIIRITNFIFTYAVTVFAGTLLISAGGPDFITCLSAAMSCTANIGPGFKLVGPACNFAVFSSFSKLVCSFLMLAGRLEPVTVLALFSKYYWKPNKAN